MLATVSVPMDLAGRRFDRLVAIRVAVMRPRRWFCECDCGRQTVVTTHLLIAGLIRSCGCLKVDALAARNAQHGDAQRGRITKEYRCWLAIKTRCLNPHSHAYVNYGARGITIDPRWAADFDAFLAAVGRAPSAAHTIDRIDNDGSYVPGNVRWATRHEQARTKRPPSRGRTTRNSRLVTFRGETMTFASFVARLGLHYKRAYHQIITLGVPIEDAVATLMRS